MTFSNQNKARKLAFKEENFQKIISFLKKGKILVLPTDTVYGFSCDAENKKAIKNLQNIKKRLENKPFLLLVSDFSMANKIVNFSFLAKKFAQKVWPGNCTIILPRKTNVFENFFPQEKYLAIRVVKNNLLKNFLKDYWKKPLISTSINISGQNLENDFNNIYQQFSSQKKVIFCFQKQKRNSLPSSIVKINSKKISIIREGVLSKDKIYSLSREIFN